MNDNLSSLMTPKNLVKDNLSRVKPLRSRLKGLLYAFHINGDHFRKCLMVVGLTLLFIK